MNHPRALIAVALGLLLAAPRPSSATELPVRAVTLSSAGLIQVERGGEVGADAPAITFRAPLDSVDDILRSLIVADPAGRVEGVRLPAQDLAAEAFRGLPVSPEDFDSRASLLNALRGQRVAVGDFEGRIAEATEGADALRLSLITPTGLRTVRLRAEEEVRLLDADLAARLARAAEALAETRSADTRQVTVALRPGATSARQVGLTYVAAGPLWKPSWRMSVPGFGENGATARLMGWAVVENHTGADWPGIRLSLVSGEAAAFRQALYSPVLLPRRELPILGSGPVDVLADAGGRPQPPAAARARVRATPMPAPLSAPIMEAAPAAASAAAQASLGRVAFVLDQPVTIRAGQTANVPFLDTRLPAGRVWWVQGLSGRHPLQAVRLRNTTEHPLPGGLITVYGAAGAETDSFLGDAQMLGVPAGETRLLAFARDQGVQYTFAERSSSQPREVALQRGRVQVTMAMRHRVLMAVDGGAARGVMVVDLPARPGETPAFRPDAEGDFGLRVEVRLEGASADHEWAWERSRTRTILLWDPALGEPLPPIWRDLSLDRDMQRLPGGSDRLAELREILADLPPDAPGRAELDALLDDFAEARHLMDAFRTAARAHGAAQAELERARRALEDRTGAGREAARAALNTASIAAERTGRAADAAWAAWREVAQRVVARGG